MKTDLTEKDRTKDGIWGLVDRIRGDKVVWMILTMLILFSIVSIFSSTSMLATMQPGTSRMDIFIDQLWIVIAGIVIIFICYKIPYIKLFRVLSQFGFALSAILLLCLILNIRAVEVNGARRAIDLGFFQLHVYEVVKVAMVLYLAWAIHAYKSGAFVITKKLASSFRRLAFLDTPFWNRMIYIFAPILIVCLGIMAGSVSSTLFIGGIMFITIIVGGIRIKDMLGPALICIAAGIAGVGLYFLTDGKVFPRVGTAVQRIFLHEEKKNLMDYTQGSQEFMKALDPIRQPESAKIAIHEGGLLGKGPGNSTQKYTVSLIFSDYMYSFIVEEYGFWGGVLIIMLYISLLARGTIIVKYCDNDYAKTAVAGLTLLITGQALMHIFINLDMGLLTGQTLPMISHGKSSFICFCVAFGVILSISKMAKDKIQNETDNATSLSPETDDGADVDSRLSDLDAFESGEFEETDEFRESMGNKETDRQ